MVGQDRGQQFIVRQDGGQNRCRNQRKGRVRRSEDREGTLTTERTYEVSSNHCRLQGGVIWAVDDDVHHRVRLRYGRQQNGVDDVYHAVVRDKVSYNHLRAVDEYAISVDGHRHIRAIEGGYHHAICEVRAQRRCTHHVVGQDGREQLRIGQNGFYRTKGQCREGRIRGSEDREGTRTAQRASEASRDDCRFQRVVIRAVDDDIYHRVGLRRRSLQNRIDDVYYAVVSDEVGYDDLSIVDENAIAVDGHRYVLPIEGRDHHAVGQIRAQCIGSYHVVGQDGSEQGVVRQNRLEGGGRKNSEGCIRGSEDRERTLTAERASEASRDDCRLQRIVIRAVDDDVHHRVRHRQHGYGAHHARLGVGSHGAIIIVDAGDIEGVRSHANPARTARNNRG